MPHDDPGHADDDPRAFRTDRRGLFAVAGAAAAAGVAGWALGSVTSREPAGSTDPAPSRSDVPVLGEGDRRAGITHPAVPQRHLHASVLDVPGDPATVVAAIDEARSRATAEGFPDDAGVVSVVVGYGARIASAVWPDRATADMTVPAFAKDVDGILSGGDVMVQVCAETAAAARDVAHALIGAVPRASVRWTRTGYRDAPTRAGTTRTSTGFIDGIINPRSAEELAAGVWTHSGDTYAVARRMTIGEAFAAQPQAAQESAIGRRRDTGAPLSGGGALDDVDLFAKTPEGRVLTPVGSHARRAHPANLGRALMLRRSYAFDPSAGFGLLFLAFLADPQTFVLTQRRLDEQDDFLQHTTADAIGVFFVPATTR